MKLSIDWVYRPSGLVRLQPSPGSLESLDAPRSFPYAAELHSVIQIM